QASSITFLGASPTAGTIYYTGGNSPLEGSGVTLDLVIGTGTPDNDGVPALCINCVLNFVTGDFLVGDGTAYVFDGGGSFTITGGVDLTGNGLLGDPGDIVAGTSLLSGAFVGQQYVLLDAGFSALQLSLGSSSVDTGLSAYYGLAAFGGNTLLLAEFVGVGEAPGPFVSTSISGVLTSVPEPTSLVLFGLSMAGFLARRRKPAI